MLLLSPFPDEEAEANKAKELPEVTQVGGSGPEWAADLQAGLESMILATVLTFLNLTLLIRKRR